MDRGPKKKGAIVEAARAGRALSEGKAQAGLRAVGADVDLQLDIAAELTHRLRRASLIVLQELQKGHLTDAAAFAGQVAMLGRQVEIRLLGAVERRAGATAVLQAVGDALPEPESPRVVSQRANQQARRRRAAAAET